MLLKQVPDRWVHWRGGHGSGERMGGEGKLGMAIEGFQSMAAGHLAGSVLLLNGSRQNRTGKTEGGGVTLEGHGLVGGEENGLVGA